MGVDRHLVEQHAFAAVVLADVIGLAAVLEALEDLALLGASGECGAAGVDLDVAAVELERGGLVGALGALEVGLEGEQLGAAEGGGLALAADLLRAVDVLGRGPQHCLALHAHGE